MKPIHKLADDLSGKFSPEAKIEAGDNPLSESIGLEMPLNGKTYKHAFAWKPESRPSADALAFMFRGHMALV